MERGYSTIAVKSLDDEQREFSGLATSPVPDRVLDIIEPLGCRYNNPTVLLRAHDHAMPIGTVHFGRPSKAGIAFKASIPKIPEPGLLKDRVDMAWGEVKHGLIRAVSVGFRPLEAEPLASGGMRFTKSEIFELSTVACPAQELATIDQVKAIDAAVLRGEASPSLDGSLSQRIGRIGLAALNEFEASEERKQIGHTHGPAVSAARSVQHMIKALCDHVEQLERRLDEQGHAYKGAWKPGRYSAGNFVTHNGSCWHCDKATDFKPGEGGGWTLAVKRGADAR